MKTMSTNSKNIDTDPPLSPANEREASLYHSTAAVVVQDQEKACSVQHRNEPSTSSDYLVSEHEDNDGSGSGSRRDDTATKDDRRRISSDLGSQIIAAGDEHDEDGSSARCSTLNGLLPAEIPPEHDDVEKSNVENRGDDNDNEEDDESEYSYDYEDDDDGHFSGFLVSSGTNGPASVVPQEDTSHSKQNVIEDEDRQGKDSDSNGNVVQYASLEFGKVSDSKKSGWKEPTQKAVSMSLRAENEKSGGRRRLAADLYKVMMTDTTEAGFEVEQKDDECMDKWIVKLFHFDSDSDLHKDLLVLGLDHVELEMNFPEQYPFEPPFVRVVRPRFKRQTGFVMNGALCMELLTNEGWNPINDIESVIVSIRSLLVVGDGRLEAAVNMPEKKREALLSAAESEMKQGGRPAASNSSSMKRKRGDEDGDVPGADKKAANVGAYSSAEAKAAYAHLTNYHKKKGWSGWWAKRG